jgi:hypothetical protein
MKAVLRDLEKIQALAEKCRKAFPETDEQMYYLLGGIVANAEDAVGALKDQIDRERFQAAMRGGFVIQ